MFHVKHSQDMGLKNCKKACAPRAFVQYSTRIDQFQYLFDISLNKMFSDRPHGSHLWDAARAFGQDVRGSGESICCLEAPRLQYACNESLHPVCLSCNCYRAL